MTSHIQRLSNSIIHIIARFCNYLYAINLPIINIPAGRFLGCLRAAYFDIKMICHNRQKAIIKFVYIVVLNKRFLCDNM